MITKTPIVARMAKNAGHFRIHLVIVPLACVLLSFLSGVHDCRKYVKRNERNKRRKSTQQTMSAKTQG